MLHCLPHALICSCPPHVALQPIWVQLELLDGFRTSVCAGRSVHLHYSSLVRITAEDENDAWRLYFFFHHSQELNYFPPQILKILEGELLSYL